MINTPALAPFTSSSRRHIAGWAACVVVAAFVLAVSWSNIDSLDTGYHVAYGGSVLDGRGIVDRDPFLYPEHAVDFVNANWGSQVLMAAAYRIAGPSGLIALRTVLVVAIFGAIAVVVRRQTRGPHWLACAWLLAAVAGYERMGLRPELFSYAVMCAMLAIVTGAMHSKSTAEGGCAPFARWSPWRIAALAALQLAWVNLHSYFLVGLMLTGAFLVGEVLERWSRRSLERAAISRRLTVALGLQIVVCFLNPWTYRGAIFPIKTLSNLSRENVMGAGPGDAGASAWSLISEFHSPFRYVDELINGRTIDAYWVLLAVAAIGFVLCIAQRRIGPAIMILLLAAMSFQMRRNIAQFALAAAPPAVGAIAAAIQGVASPKARRHWLSGALAWGAMLLSAWWTYGVVTGRFYYVERRITRQFGVGLSERTFAEGAVHWLASQSEIQPNLFVDYFSSSNTLLWLPERFKLFVDTNTFACPEPVLATAFDVGLGKRDHNAVFGQSKVNVVLLHCGPDTQALIRRLAADSTTWALVYVDRQAVIFVRRMVEHLRVIRAHQPAQENLDVGAWIAAYDEPAYTKALSLGSAVGVPMSLGWHAPAAALMREAVRLAPDYDDGWYFLGICEANMGRASGKAGRLDEARDHVQAAANCFAKVVALRPNHPQAGALLAEMRQVLESMLGRQ